ncbi:MAG: pyridoxal phosphate-dependent aminotransferase [Promethearchaeota archaeon]
MFSQRVSRIEPFMVMEILELARQLEREGRDVVHLEIGEPDFETPGLVRDEACGAVTRGFTHYTPSRGWKPLRDGIAGYLERTRGVSYDPDGEVIVSSGSSPAFLLALGALVDPGDGVVVTNPCYSCYPNFVKFFGGVVQDVEVHEERGFALNPGDLDARVDGRTKVVVLNSPANPTGEVIPREVLGGIAEVAREHDLWVISDEIYAGISYDEGGVVPSILEFPGMKERTVLIDGFSKFWAMTGWRLGYVCAPPDLTRAMDKIQQNFLICAPSASQAAGLRALDPDVGAATNRMLETYRERRDAIVDGLNAIRGISCRKPHGAFYAFANISSLDTDSYGFCKALLQQEAVASTPGVAFGSNGEGFVRFSYSNSVDNIWVALERIRVFVEENYA